MSKANIIKVQLFNSTKLTNLQPKNAFSNKINLNSKKSISFFVPRTHKYYEKASLFGMNLLVTFFIMKSQYNLLKEKYWQQLEWH